MPAGVADEPHDHGSPGSVEVLRQVVEAAEKATEALEDQRLWFDDQIRAIYAEADELEESLARAQERIGSAQVDGIADPSDLLKLRANVDEAQARRDKERKVLRGKRLKLERERDRCGVELHRAQQKLMVARNELLSAESAEQQRRVADVQASIDEMAPVVSAQREVLGSSGASELADAYETRASSHEKGGRFWVGCLLASVIFVLGAVVLLFRVNAPADAATTSVVVSHMALNAVVLGILAFVARISAANFRAQKHMQEVALNKAAALRTFNRIVVASPEPEVRAAIASVLAHNVFAATDTGLLTESSTDQMTILERVAPSFTQRPT